MAGAFWRKDADEPVVDRALELAPVENKLNREVENIRDILRRRRCARWMFPRSFKASSVRTLRCRASVQYAIAWSSIVESCN